MNKFKIILAAVFLLLASTVYISSAFGWYDKTHLAAAKAAGYYKWYNAAGADIAKIKAGGIEGYNHFFNNPSNIEITPEIVLKQTGQYNNPNNRHGHLYGAIIASLREYQNTAQKGKYAEHLFAFSAHYIADLSQPLHNIPYDSFNRQYHGINDGTVEKEVLENTGKIEKHMYKIDLRPSHFEDDLAKEIARIANLSAQFGHKLRKENRNMTKKEAYIQLGHSASLIKAVLQHFGKTTKSIMK
jgi:hypothetical protein